MSDTCRNGLVFFFHCVLELCCGYRKRRREPQEVQRKPLGGGGSGGSKLPSNNDATVGKMAERPQSPAALSPMPTSLPWVVCTPRGLREMKSGCLGHEPSDRQEEGSRRLRAMRGRELRADHPSPRPARGIGRPSALP